VREAQVGFNGIERGVDLVGGSREKCRLPREAFARADAASDPFGFDLAPFRRGKALEYQVGRIAKRNRTVEVDGDIKIHENVRTRPRLLKTF
jgi:hypothetical protein